MDVEILELLQLFGNKTFPSGGKKPDLELILELLFCTDDKHAVPQEEVPCVCLTDASDILRLQLPGDDGFDPDMASGAAWWAVLLERVMGGTVGPLARRLILTAANNAHGLGNGGTDSRPWGYAIYPEAVFINHSCLPNVDKVFTEDGQMVLYARRNIAKGKLVVHWIPVKTTIFHITVFSGTSDWALNLNFRYPTKMLKNWIMLFRH